MSLYYLIFMQFLAFFTLFLNTFYPPEFKFFIFPFSSDRKFFRTTYFSLEKFCTLSNFLDIFQTIFSWIPFLNKIGIQQIDKFRNISRNNDRPFEVTFGEMVRNWLFD